jgi:hypothetical protein
VAHRARPARDSWWRTAPVLTIAILALIVSTAGGAYAVGKNSIGSKQLKKNAVTSSKIKNGAVQSADVKDGSLSARDLAPGTIPPQPARSARVFFAKVDAQGGRLAGSPEVVSTAKIGGAGLGFYRVTLSFDPSPCGVTATANTSGTVATANVEVNPANSVHVGMQVRDSAADGPFTLIITC